MNKAYEGRGASRTWNRRIKGVGEIAWEWFESCNRDQGLCIQIILAL